MKMVVQLRLDLPQLRYVFELSRKHSNYYNEL